MNWQARIDRPDAPAVPIWIKRMRRTFWCPPGYERIVRYVASHPDFTQRQAAEATGYSLGGFERALQRLRQWGALIVTTARGRLGRTRARVQTDVRTINVSPAGERVFLHPSLRFAESETSPVVGTFDPGPVWRALGEALRCA